MITSYAPHTANGRCPYDAHARTWYRYARGLTNTPFDAARKMNEALTYSRRLRARAFVLPAVLELTTRSEEGLRRLKRHMDEHRVRYAELAARIVQVDDEDPASDEAHLLLEEPDPTSSRGCRYLVGRLPQEDACWLVPLLRLERDAYGTCPVVRFFVERCHIRSRGGRVSAEASEVRVAVAHAHEAARQWLDWSDERKQCFEALYRSTFYDERAYAPVLA